MPKHKDSRRPEAGGAILTAGVAIWAIIHTAKKYSLFDFFKYSFYVTIAIAAIVLVILVVDRRTQKRPFSEDVVPLLRVLVAIPIGGIVYFSLGVVFKDGLLRLYTTLPIGIFTVLLALPAGLLLFLFRLKLRAVYGLSEALVGLAVAAQRATDGDNLNVYLAILTAGVYLVVRGLDNIHQGLTKPPLDPLAMWLLTRFRSKSESHDEPQDQ